MKTVYNIPTIPFVLIFGVGISSYNKGMENKRKINTNLVGFVVRNTPLSSKKLPGYAQKITWSPDGKMILQCDGYKAIISDATTRKTVCELLHQDPIHKGKFSPDSKKVAMISMNDKVIIWDLEPIEEVKEFLHNETTEEQKKLMNAIQKKKQVLKKLKLTKKQIGIFDTLPINIQSTLKAYTKRKRKLR